MTDIAKLTGQLPFELAQEFGVVPVADEGNAIAVATAPHMTVASLSAVRQRLGRPLRAQSVSAEEFRSLLTSAYSRVARPAPATDSASAIARSSPERDEQDLLASAAEAVKSVALHVEQHNPAQRLYQRLGFVFRQTEGVHLLLEWQPPQSS